VNAPREIPDFASLSRRAFHSALPSEARRRRPAATPLLSQPSRAAVVDPAADLIRALTDGRPFRLASRSAGLNRIAATRIIEQVAAACVDLHVSVLTALPPHGPTIYAGSCVLAGKDRSGHPQSTSRTSERSIWTHLWTDEPSGLILQWLAGPPSVVSPQEVHGTASVVQSTSRAMTCRRIEAARVFVPDETALTSWLRVVDIGSWTKARRYWVVTAILVAAHNFCATEDSTSTPAMRAGWATRPWSAEELAVIEAQQPTSLPISRGPSA
jgi:hypothetical protein